MFYGLALALGGGEVTMEELAGLYAMLANDGVLRPLRVDQVGHDGGGRAAAQPGGGFVTLDMLRHNPRPDGDGALAPRTRWPVAWKTGTSWGFRDAWAAGIVGPYVLVVGSAISTARAIRRSSAWTPPRRCSSASPTP